MLLKLKARHFKGAEYKNPCFCAIGKAANEIAKPGCSFSEGVDDIGVYENNYHIDDLKHISYDEDMFDNDCAQAEIEGYDDTIIRRIRIKGLEKYINKGGNP